MSNNIGPCANGVSKTLKIADTAIVLLRKQLKGNSNSPTPSFSLLLYSPPNPPLLDAPCQVVSRVTGLHPFPSHPTLPPTLNPTPIPLSLLPHSTSISCLLLELPPPPPRLLNSPPLQMSGFSQSKTIELGRGSGLQGGALSITGWRRSIFPAAYESSWPAVKWATAADGN